MATIDISSLNLDEVRDLMARLENRLQELVDQRRLELLQELDGLSQVRRGRHISKRAERVSYKGPNGEFWTGWGKTPKWLLALEAEGKPKSKFEVKKKVI